MDSQKKQDSSDQRTWGSNPCHEIALERGELCRSLHKMRMNTKADLIERLKEGKECIGLVGSGHGMYVRFVYEDNVLMAQELKSKIWLDPEYFPIHVMLEML